jgi:hypothetical protein
MRISAATQQGLIGKSTVRKESGLVVFGNGTGVEVPYLIGFARYAEEAEE